MALDCLDNICKLKGLKVEVTEKGQKLIGSIDFYEKAAGVLGLLMNGKMETFQKSDIDDLKILGEEQRMMLWIMRNRKHWYRRQE